MPRLYLALLCVLACAIPASTHAQTPDLSRLPKNYQLSEDGRRLVRGRLDNARLYEQESVPVVELLFDGEDWFGLADSVGLLGSVVFEGDTLRDAFVEVKGYSSDFLNTTRKKSFNVAVDSVHEDQDVAGYASLNLHAGLFDESHLREVVFYDIARRHLPAAQSNLVELRINGRSWGAYTNTQQLNRKFLDQWFFAGNGPRWRGESPYVRTNGPDTCAAPTLPGRKPSWSGLVYHGRDSADYAEYYTARGRQQPGDWDKLARFITKLNLTPPTQLADTLPRYLDVDEALWFIAHEVLLTDDDGYVFKTQSDFQLYFDPSTGQMIPLEYDGNGSLLESQQELPPTFRAGEPCVPLVHRLLSVPRWRQRYLAHFRDLVREQFDTAYLGARIDAYAASIDDLVRADTLKRGFVTYDQFQRGVPALKRTIRGRFEYLSQHPDLRASGIAIAEVSHAAVDASSTIEGGTDYFVSARVGSAGGAGGGGGFGDVYVHAAPDPRVLPKGVSARFRENRMFDDGLHGDGAAGDGIYGARLTAQEAGALHRYYIEVTGATETDPSEFLPTGAEHETFYFVATAAVAGQLGPVRINEVVADNETGATDEEGKFEDWIELYNDSNQRVDLGGYAISDDPEQPRRYVFPEGVAIAPRGYLIVWCDDDADDGPLHTNFKLSKGGEPLSLVDASGTIVDTVSFPELGADLAYARQPDGTGVWKIIAPTFGITNGGSVSVRNVNVFPDAKLYPNPSAGGAVTLELLRAGLEVSLYDQLGRRVWQRVVTTELRIEIPTDGMAAGVYVVTVRGAEGVRQIPLVRR